MADSGGAAQVESVPKASQDWAAWRRGALVVVVALAAGYLAWAWSLGRRRIVYFVDGLSRPYSIRVNGAPVALDPTLPTLVTVAEGTITVEVDEPGLALPPQTLRIGTPFLSRPLQRRSFVANPDGVALLVWETATYAADPGQAPPAAAAFLLGETQYEFENLDCIFEPFPAQAEVPAGRTTGLQRVAQLNTVTVNWALEVVRHQLGMERATAWAQQRLVLEPGNLDCLAFLSEHLERAALVAWLEPGLVARPVRVEWHRFYQAALQKAGKAAELEARYRAWLTEAAGDSALTYLLSRVVSDPAEAEALTQRAAAAAAPCPQALAAVARAHLCSARFDEALEPARQAAARSPGDDYLDALLVNVLLATGRLDDALQVADRRLRPSPAAGLWLREETQLLALRWETDQDRAKMTVGARARDAGAALGNPGVFERDLASLLAYIWGDLDIYLQLQRQAGTPEHRFQVALTVGDLDETEKTLAEIQRTTVSTHLLAYLALAGGGRTEAANRQFEVAVARLRAGAGTDPAVADCLAGKRSPAESAAALNALDFPFKPIVLVVLGSRYPAQREAAFALARKLNFRRLFPYRFLDGILNPPPPDKAPAATPAPGAAAPAAKPAAAAKPAPVAKPK